jgi:hypothetical protein
MEAKNGEQVCVLLGVMFHCSSYGKARGRALLTCGGHVYLWDDEWRGYAVPDGGEVGKLFFELCKSGGHYRMLRGRPLIGIGKAGEKSMVHGRVVVDLNQYYQDEIRGRESPN